MEDIYLLSSIWSNLLMPEKSMGGNSQTDTHGSDGGLDGAEFLLQDGYLRLVQLPFDPGGITLCLWRRSGLPPPQLRALRGSGTEKGGARLNFRGTGQPNCGQACDWLFWKLKREPLGLAAMEPGFPHAHPETTGIKPRG